MEASFTSSYNSPNPRVRRPMTAARPDRNPPFRSPGRPITATLSPRTRRSIAPSPPVRDTRPWSGIASWGSPRSPGSWDEASISRPQSARSRPQSPRSPSSPSRSPWVGDLGDQPYHCRQAGAWTVAHAQKAKTATVAGGSLLGVLAFMFPWVPFITVLFQILTNGRTLIFTLCSLEMST